MSFVIFTFREREKRPAGLFNSALSLGNVEREILLNSETLKQKYHISIEA